MSISTRTAPPIDSPTSVAPAAGARATRQYRRWRGSLAVAAGLVGAWAVPLGADAVHADWVLPPLILLGVASLLRAGRTPLDRVVLALALLLGATCVAGLLFSVWPWGLAPVPIAGGALTGLVLVGAVLRRVPRLPARLPAGDGVVIGLWALCGLSVFWPYRHLDATGRFGMVAAGGDLAPHFSLTDTMRGIGGYVFMHQHEASATVWSVYRTYPQGLHLTGAVLMGFMRSSGTRGTALSELHTFTWLEPATFVLTCLMILWAVRRVAGPGVRPSALLPAAAVGAGYLAWSDPLMLLWMGYWPEIAALGEFAVLLALLARPLHRTREQIMVVTALAVAISYTYFLMLPIVGLVALAWVVVSRRRLLHHRGFFVAVVVSGAAGAAVMLTVNLSAFDAADHLLVGGAILHPDNRMLAALGLAAVAGMSMRGGWRSPARRVMGVAVPVTVAFTFAVGAYNLRYLGTLDYFYYKSTHLMMVVFLLALGPVAAALNAPAHRAGPVHSGSVHRAGPVHSGSARRAGQVHSGSPRRWAASAVRLVPTAALTVAALAAFGPVGSANYGRLYLERQFAWDWPARSATLVAERLPARTGVITVVWAGRSYAPQASHWASVLLRDEGVAWRGVYWISNEPFTGALPRADIETFLARVQPEPVRFVTDNPGLLAELRAVHAGHPRWRLEIIDLPLPR